MKNARGYGRFFRQDILNQLNPSRRKLLGILLRSGVAVLTAHTGQQATAGAHVLPHALPDPAGHEPGAYPIFLALSYLVTLRPQLDEALARRMHPLFLDEPWGAHHIQSTYAQLLALLANDPPLASHPHHALGSGQAWFARHLLTTWYLGVYYHERMPPQRIVHAEALMFDAAQPGYPLPFINGTGFSEWRTPPPGRTS